MFFLVTQEIRIHFNVHNCLHQLHAGSAALGVAANWSVYLHFDNMCVNTR